ncbi:MAG: NAD-dependent epimerase/dehydratase family protein [Alphaproteobacteria bacterium]|nr:NAD-dependent epimerase/dehydratase family protein [Alphaproteobacteria bacterium]
MGETVLVTGGSGFVAAWCIVGLLQKGHAVRTTIRSPAKEAGVRQAVERGGVSTERLEFAIADLTKDDGWDAAMQGVSHVLHVASPLGDNGTSADRDAFVAPARDGTLRVLGAATKAGVKRVVMTSAAATARVPIGSDKVADESVWSDPDDPRFDAYRRSKILAERAAWDFMANRATEFTTILPGAVFGPILSKDQMGSTRVIQAMLRGRPPALARLAFWIVDVRDLADLHIRAMTAPEAANQRFLAVGDLMWMPEVAATLRARLGGKAGKVPVRRLPDFLVKIMALFQPPLRMLVAEVGRRNAVSSEKARRLLGFAPRPAEETVVACAESLIAFGVAG